VPFSFLARCSPYLAREIDGANDSTRRAIVLAVCKWAVESTIPTDPIANSSLDALAAGAYGDRQAIANFQKHVDDLDQVYFRAKEARRDYQLLFAKARAANSVVCALDPEPFRAAVGSLYEVCAGLGSAPVEAEVRRVFGLPAGDD